MANRVGDARIADKFQWPNGGEWAVIAIIALALIAVSPILFHRTVISGMSDTQVFFRAGWAVWTGYPLYEVADMHGWHYHYPPPLALLMGPFADPLPGFPKPSWALPFPLAVAVWYVLSIAAVFAAIHIWAKALTPFADAPANGGAQPVYWTLRLFPLIALLPYIGASWARGQPTDVVTLLVVLFLVLYIADRPFAAAIALSAAISIKMFPIVLVIIPLLRRDVRSLTYVTFGCVFFLFAVPALVLGVDPTIEIYRELWTDRLSGLLTGHMSPTIRDELSLWPNGFVGIGSIVARIFSAPTAGQLSLPDWAIDLQRVFDILMVGLVATVGRGRFWRLSGKQPEAGYSLLIAGAVLLAALPAMLPTAKGHYHEMAWPLAAIIALETLRRPPGSAASWWLLAWSIAAWAAFIIVDSTLVEPLRPYGLTTLTTLVLTAVGMIVLARSGRPQAAIAEPPTSTSKPIATTAASRH